jgi:hypothetical protein
MTPRYIIHVGPMKTASTYLQLCFTAVREDLAKLGVCDPAELADPKATFMHMPRYRALARSSTSAQAATTPSCSPALHSCEHLVFIRPTAFRALRDLLGNADVTIDDTAPPSTRPSTTSAPPPIASPAPPACSSAGASKPPMSSPSLWRSMACAKTAANSTTGSRARPASPKPLPDTNAASTFSQRG